MGEEALGKKLEFGGDKTTGRKWSKREKNLWAYTFLPFSHQTPIGQPLWKPVGKEPGNTVCRRSAGTGSEGKKT